MKCTPLSVLRHCQGDQNCHFTTPGVALRHLELLWHSFINILMLGILLSPGRLNRCFLLIIQQLSGSCRNHHRYS